MFTARGDSFEGTLHDDEQQNVPAICFKLKLMLFEFIEVSTKFCFSASEWNGISLTLRF